MDDIVERRSRRSPDYTNLPNNRCLRSALASSLGRLLDLVHKLILICGGDGMKPFGELLPRYRFIANGDHPLRTRRCLFAVVVRRTWNPQRFFFARIFTPGSSPFVKSMPALTSAFSMASIVVTLVAVTSPQGAPSA